MKSKWILIVVIAATIIAVVMVGKLVVKTNTNNDFPNSVTLPVDSLSRDDSTYHCYNEVRKIILNINFPQGIAISHDDRIYVVGDSSLFTLNSAGILVSRFNIGRAVRCIAAGKDNKLYIGAENHVEVYDTSGTLSKSWKILQDSSVITSVAVNQNRVYVADAQFEYVYIFDTSGKQINKIGSKDTTDEVTRFIVPSYYFDVAVDPRGNLWVVNPGRHILINFTDSGEVRFAWGASSMEIEGFFGCCNPSNIAILSDGSFITSEKGMVRVKKYSANGDFECVLAGAGNYREGSRGLDIAVDSEQRVFVLEPDAGLIHVFEKVK